MDSSASSPRGRGPARGTLLRLAVPAALALALLPAAFLALLPPLFGKAPAVTVSPVERALCILDPDGSAGILVAGDSRAQYHLVPALLEEATGRKAVNVAQWLHLGGDPVTLVNALRRRPEALASRPVLVLSVTIDALNDLGFKGLPMVNLFNWRLRDHARVLAERQKAYPRFFFSHMLPSVGALIRNRWTGRAFRCGADIHRPPRLLASRGFEVYEGRKRAALWRMPQDEEDYLLEGGQWRNLRASLDWLSGAPVRDIVLINAPMDTAWLRASDGPVPVAMQDRFSRMLEKEASRHPKVTYLDFFRHPLPQLTDSMFHDQTHLNREGAEVFSRHIGEVLAGLDRAPRGRD